MSRKLIFFLTIIICTVSLLGLPKTSYSHSCYSHSWDSNRADAHAPIGVMGDHAHHKGGVMFSYRYAFMGMDGLKDGTDNLSTSEVLEDFMVAPTEMDVHMHMFGMMYAPSDRVTFIAMIPYIKKSMKHKTRMGTEFKTESEGFGDLKVSALIPIYQNKNHKILINAGLSFPTGSINEKDDTPAGNNQRLPYPMQLGSGTFDLLPGITYTAQFRNFSTGAQISGVIRLGENDKDYTLGNIFQATSWGSLSINRWISTSLRLRWITKGDIDGADPALDPNMVPTADPSLSGFNKLDIFAGINFYVPKGPSLIKGQRLALEIGTPVYQDLDGPQLETDWSLTLGWRYAFSLY